MAAQLLERVEVVQQRVEVGTEEEKKALLPKLESLRQAIADLTAHYDAKLSEVKDRNQLALNELQKLDRRVKARATDKENQENKAKEEAAAAPKPKPKVKAEKKPERLAPLLAPRPRPVPMAHEHFAWEPEVYSADHLPWDAWSMPAYVPVPTGQAEFFANDGDVHTDQIWSPCASRPVNVEILGEACPSPGLAASPALTFIPTPSPDWADHAMVDVSVGSLLRSRSVD